jgi:hypothetical protein
MLVTMLSSHAGDDAAKATWPLRDIEAESCWRGAAESYSRWRCRGDLAATRCKCLVMLVTMLLSHVDDGTATQGCTGCGKVAQPLRLENQGVVAS